MYKMQNYINNTSNGAYSEHTSVGLYNAVNPFEVATNDIRAKGVPEIIAGTVQRNNLVTEELRAKKGAGENKIALAADCCNNDVRPT